MTARVLLTVTEAAESVGCAVGTIRKAIRATDPNTFPPPLKAKLGSRGQHLIRPADLDAWADSLPDA